MRRPHRPRLLVAALALLVPVAAHAQWSTNPSQNDPVCLAIKDQKAQQIASDGAGGAFIVWIDARDSVFNVYAQHLNANGYPMWDSDGIPVHPFGSIQQFPRVIADGEGGAIVTWEDAFVGPRVVAQRLSASGERLWDPGGVDVAAETSQGPCLVSDGAGGAIFAWMQYAGSGNRHIYAQRVSAGGVRQWAPGGVAVCTAANTQVEPGIVTDGAGGAIVCWRDHRILSTFVKDDIYAQRIDAGGTGLWAVDGVPVCAAVEDQQAPDIAPDGAGGAVVTWTDYRNNVEGDAYAQRVDADGVRQWTAHGVPVCTAVKSQVAPRIASDGANGAIVTWFDARSGPSFRVYVQRIDATGIAEWTPDGIPISNGADDARSPTIVPDGEGGAIFTWYGTLTPGGDYDIVAQRIDAGGSPLWDAGGNVVSMAVRNQYSPVLAADASGGAIIAWFDDRDTFSPDPLFSNLDIFAQRIGPDGSIGGLVSVGPGAGGEPGRPVVAPNPAHRDVSFSVPQAAGGAIEVLDLGGRRLWSARFEGSRAHWNGTTPEGGAAPAGVYLARITSGGRVTLTRFVWLR